MSDFFTVMLSYYFAYSMILSFLMIFFSILTYFPIFLLSKSLSSFIFYSFWPYFLAHVAKALMYIFPFSLFWTFHFHFLSFFISYGPETSKSYEMQIIKNCRAIEFWKFQIFEIVKIIEFQNSLIRSNILAIFPRSFSSWYLKFHNSKIM